MSYCVTVAIKQCSTATTSTRYLSNNPLRLSTVHMHRYPTDWESCECHLDAPRGTQVLLGPILATVSSRTGEACNMFFHAWEDTGTMVKTCLDDAPERNFVGVWTSEGRRLSWNVEPTANYVNNRTRLLIISQIYIYVLGTETSVIVLKSHYCIFL